MISILSQIKRFQETGISLPEGKEFEIILQSKHTAVTCGDTANFNDNNEDNKINVSENKMLVGRKYKVTVKKYMTEPATLAFDFQKKWNNDIPMPLLVMQGELIKETRGMAYMKLNGFAESTCTCSICGRTLTNPISKLYGIGPECSAKVGIVFDTMQEDDTIVKSKMESISWEGWIIKSAIKKFEEVM